MSTILFFVAVIVLAIIVMSHIPGLEPFVKPIIDLLFTAFKAIVVNGLEWIFFLVKIVWFSHLDLFKNLIFSAESLDPTLALKNP